MAVERVSGINSGAPISAPAAPKSPSSPAPQTAASLQFNGGFRREGTDDPTTILTDWKNNRGGLYESGFLGIGKKNLSVGDALKDLNKNDSVYVKNRFGEYDKLKSLEDLLILNSVDGTFTDHHRADPNLRLPLLFLGGQTTTTDNPKEKISPYEAYKRMRENKAVKVNGQAMTPASMTDKVIASWLPADADPGQALRRSVGISGNDGGWKVDGRDTSGNVLYLAMLKGANQVSFNGTPVLGREGIALVNFLQHGQERDQLPAPLAQAASEFRNHLSHLPAPNRDAHGAFKALNANQPVRVGNDTVRSFTDLAILDALQGDRQPTAALPSNVHAALLALSDGGLNSGTFAAYQALQAGQAINYTFRGGPTNEPITMSIPSLSAAPGVQQQVAAQRERDQFRPDLADFKRLTVEKGAASGGILAGNLATSQAARSGAQADIPRQEDVIRGAQIRFDDNARRLQEVEVRIGQAAEEERRASRRVDDTRYRYDNQRRDVDRLTDQYNYIARDVERINRLASEQDRLAADEERLANQPAPTPAPQAPPAGDRPRPPSGGSDRPTPPSGGTDRPTPPSSGSDDREIHRQKAAQYRKQAQEYRNQANHKTRELEQLRWPLENSRRELDRRQRDLYEAQSNHQVAARYLRDFQNEASGYQAQMNGARQDMEAANAAISRDRQTIQDADTVIAVGASMQPVLSEMLATVRGLKSHKDFEANRAQLKANLQHLATSSSEMFQRIHGPALLQSLEPIRTLLANMDKPALGGSQRK